MKRSLHDFAVALLAAHGLPPTRAVGYLPLLRQATRRELEPGDTVCRQGDAPDGLDLLAEGSLEVLVAQGERSEQVAVLEAPAVVGHIGLVDTGARSATVRAQGEAVVLHLPQPVCDALIRGTSLEAARFRELLLAAMFDTLIGATAHLRDLLGARGDGVETRG